MLPTEPKIGYVFRYAYLWHRLHVEVREEADKDRPCLVLAIIAVEEDGTQAVRVLPITHSRPTDSRDAVEIPQLTKQRLKLDDGRSWIVLTESNRFIWPGPDIRPIDSETGYFGAIPPALLASKKRRFVELAKSRRHGSVTRTE